MSEFKGRLSEQPGRISGNLSAGSGVSGGLSAFHGEVETFVGDYEYTPGEEMQTIEISKMKAKQNIIINPVPSNYGRISWDGRKLKIY